MPNAERLLGPEARLASGLQAFSATYSAHRPELGLRGRGVASASSWGHRPRARPNSLRRYWPNEFRQTLLVGTVESPWAPRATRGGVSETRARSNADATLVASVRSWTCVHAAKACSICCALRGSGGEAVVGVVGRGVCSQPGSIVMSIPGCPPRLSGVSMSSDSEFLFTSESVTEGHPDKIADQISDAVLDAVLTDDPYGRVACETLVTTGLVVVAGEITTSTFVDIPAVARETVRRIGYDDASAGFDCDTCAVISTIDRQSPDIAQGVSEAFERSAAGSGPAM